MAKYPAGYRFVPTDEELLDYLKMRIRNDPIPVTEVIRDANVYGCDPRKLIAEIFPEGGERQESGYFFTPRDRKYPNGSRPNRKAGNGYWKATGADQKIKERNQVIGQKRSLTFLIGDQPQGKKTRWLMHEYTLPGQLSSLKRNEQDMRLDWALCHVYQRPPRRSDYQDFEEVVVDNPAADVQVAEDIIAAESDGPATTEAHYTTAMVPVPEEPMMPEALDGEAHGIISAAHGTEVEADHYTAAAMKMLDGLGMNIPNNSMELLDGFFGMNIPNISMELLDGFGMNTPDNSMEQLDQSSEEMVMSLSSQFQATQTPFYQQALQGPYFTSHYGFMPSPEFMSSSFVPCPGFTPSTTGQVQQIVSASTPQ